MVLGFRMFFVWGLLFVVRWFNGLTRYAGLMV